MQSLNQIRELLAARGIRPKHRLGQNFLHDHNQLRRIVDAGAVRPGDLVLEVNGLVQNEASDCREVPGRIALQSEGAHIEFQKVELRPIVARQFSEASDAAVAVDLISRSGAVARTHEIATEHTQAAVDALEGTELDGRDLRVRAYFSN